MFKQREAWICYAAVIMSTAYDYFSEDHPSIKIKEIFKFFKENAENVVRIFFKRQFRKLKIIQNAGVEKILRVLI